ncbi:DinB family protein [Nocardia sp. 2]|uniref:DinB family protein n=1 Tax=Nocardia acididurans TaxID=2802282 RepID=A0ABS1M9J7_9NOCA|nr:DinB family protein [Nocardia acididurans]MBL1077317.1 DinB family protein [Nocardia acididurans]
MTDREREDLITHMADQRRLFQITVRGIDDDQARQRTTVSELTLGGLLHHIIATERHWTTVLIERDETAEFDVSELDSAHRMAPEETVSGLLAEWDALADQTEKLIRELDSFDARVPIPTAPWAPERQYWPVRHVLYNLFREFAHHSGHADIIREALDGANTTQQRV